jgi:hypothetical protein
MTVLDGPSTTQTWDDLLVTYTLLVFELTSTAHGKKIELNELSSFPSMSGVLYAIF